MERRLFTVTAELLVINFLHDFLVCCTMLNNNLHIIFVFNIFSIFFVTSRTFSSKLRSTCAVAFVLFLAVTSPTCDFSPSSASGSQEATLTSSQVKSSLIINFAANMAE